MPDSTEATPPAGPLQELTRRGRELRDLDAIDLLLTWDQRVMMPPKGAPSRARQMATVGNLRHARLVDPELGALIDRALSEPALSPDDAAAVRKLARQRSLATRVPARLVDELAEASSAGYATWSDARPANDFAAMIPPLERLLALKLEEAEALGYAGEPYDAHLDLFEEGSTVEEVAPMLSGLAGDASALLRAIMGSSEPPPPLPRGPYPAEAQLRYAHEVALSLGYDFEGGRLDLTAHPFMAAMARDDARITVRLSDADLMEGVRAAAHEAGHALYEQGLPAHLEGTYAGAGASYAAHESQSRLFENHVARSRPYLAGQLPRLGELFPQLAALDATALYRSANIVQPSLIRVEADEVTYPLHIAVRFRVELALFRRELTVRDMPAAFNEAMRDLVGITPPSDSDGVLQDVHWPAGLFGYFPTYAQGSVYSAALFERATADLGGPATMDAALERGDLGSLLTWLRDRVHRHGATLNARELMQGATGMPATGPIDTGPYMRHLRARYGDIYALPGVGAA